MIHNFFWRDCIVLIIGIVIGSGTLYLYYKFTPQVFISEVRLSNTEYTFINPLLDISNPISILPDDVRRTEGKILKYIEQAKNQKAISTASVFFRDLNNGPHFSINHEEKYTPASLLKLPILIGFLKQAEVDTTLLDTPLFYKQQLKAPQFPHSQDIENIKPGNSYTVLELLNAMVANSDNEATLLLMNELSQSNIDRVYKDFSVPFQPIVNAYEPFITASQYASFFRILYNATYVNQKYSELGLRILADSTFTEGLRKKLPSDIAIASKFGVYELGEETNFHECGIVYTNNPYLLCIMTKGTDYKSQESVIAEISRLVYEGLQANN